MPFSQHRVASLLPSPLHRRSGSSVKALRREIEHEFIEVSARAGVASQGMDVGHCFAPASKHDDGTQERILRFLYYVLRVDRASTETAEGVAE